MAAFDVSRLIAFANSDADCVIAALPVADASRYGSLDVGMGGRLLGFREKQPGAD